MDLFAVMPGVHAIDALMLTDVESGQTMNLRYETRFFFVRLDWAE